MEITETQRLFGLHARHVPAWLYVQHQGQHQGLDTVSFVGASRTSAALHPLRYGTDWPHQFMVGEIIVRPRVLIGTSTLRGTGLGGLATADHDLDRMLADGELILGTEPDLALLREGRPLPGDE